MAEEIVAGPQTLGAICIFHYLVDCKRVKAKVPASHHISAGIPVPSEVATHSGETIGHSGVGYVCVCNPKIILGVGLHRGTGELWNVSCPECMADEIFLSDAEQCKDRNGHLHPRLRDHLESVGRAGGGCCG